jgi:hypothetical protein
VGNGKKLKEKWSGKNVYFAWEMELITASTVMEQAKPDYSRVI